MYVATHKKFDVPNISGYEAIEVGAAMRKKHFGYICDNDGENISEKNSTFCELTAYYWIWKNSMADIVGLCHYRRYFSQYRIKYSQEYYLTTKQINELLKRYEIILPEPFYWKHHNLLTGYVAGAGFAKDLDVIKDIIIERYPEYEKEYVELLKQDKAAYCNMLVLKKELFDEYCAWLFSILFEAERRIDISQYTIGEKRIFGYMSELLLNLWVKHNQLSAYYQSMCFVGTQGKKRKMLSICDYLPFTKKITKAVNCMDDIF